MNIQKYRSSFTCHIVTDNGAGEGLARGVTQAGYQTAVSDSLESFLKSAVQDPPHFVLLMRESFESEAVKPELLKIHQTLPESEIILLVNEDRLSLAWEQVGRNVYTVVTFPIRHPLQVIKELDHAARNTYYKYQNEQLHEALKEVQAGGQQQPATDSVVEAKDPFFSYADFQRSLFQQLSHGSSIEIFMKELHRIFEKQPGKAVYFKYVGARKTIIHQFSAGIQRDDISELGISFPKTDPGFRKSHIKEVETHPAFQEMLKSVFNVEKYHVLKLEVLGEVFGVLVLWDIEADSEEFSYVENSFNLLNRNCLAVELEKRLHTNQIFDPISMACNKHHFLQKMAEEIARARRTSLPVSFLLFSIDNMEDIARDCDREDFSLFLKSMVRIIQKHSRINDVIGRLGQDEFGLLLPHTASKGGAIKAERIRRMIESADFSQVLPSHPQVTLSLSVSEYPGVCKDADELFQSADRALYDLKQKELNKVVMVKAPEGFVADFVTPKPNY